MASKSNQNWHVGYTLYFLASALIAFVAFAIRQKHPYTLVHGAAIGLLWTVIVIAVLVLFFWWLKKKTATKFFVGIFVSITLWVVTKLWHLILAYGGAGLASFAIAELLHSLSGKLAFSSLLHGPLAFLTLPNKLFVVLFLLVWTGGFAELMWQHNIVKNVEGKGSLIEVGRNIRKAVTGTDLAPLEQPKEAHFVEIKKEISNYVIKDSDLASRVAFCQADLASDWGKKKKPTWIGLPKEGSGIIFGAPGSGKGLAVQRMLLDIETANPKKGILPTKVISLSVKPRDLSAATVKWLRSQGLDVEMWDLTGKTIHTDRYGTPIRWSPVMSSGTFDLAKDIAKRLVESGREPESRGRDEFWLTQAMLIIGPCLLAAYLRKTSYKKALKWAVDWTNPDESEVDRILFADMALNTGNGSKEALRAWQDTRKMLLSKEGDTDWKEAHGLPASGTTGMSIQATLNGLMLGLATESAFRATDNPNFNSRDWIRAEGSAALFLVGNMDEEGMTRSLLATQLDEIISEATDLANDDENGRLPYRLLILADELANLCPVPNLQKIYSTARSTRIQIVAVFQSLGQVENVYGADLARILLDASVCTMFLSGISDPQLIQKLKDIGGSKQVELNDGVVSTSPLIEGHYMTAMRAPDVDTGEPGNALLLMSGGIAEAKSPFWALDKRYDDRGEVISQHVESTKNMRRKAHKYQAMWDDITGVVKGWFGAYSDASPVDKDAEELAVEADASAAPDIEDEVTTTAEVPPSTGPITASYARPLRDCTVKSPTNDTAIRTKSSIEAVTTPPARPLIVQQAPALDEGDADMKDSVVLDAGGTSFISPQDGARTTILKGAPGPGPWFARITGVTKNDKFSRSFCDKKRSGTDGALTWAGPLSDGIYEWSDFFQSATEPTNRSSGFALVKEGRIGAIDQRKAYKLICATPAAPQPVPTPASPPEYEYEANGYAEFNGNEDQWVEEDFS